METLPGIQYHPVIYYDDEVFIRKSWEGIQVYHNVEYNTPLKGRRTNGWLLSGTWSIAHGKYYQRDGIGRCTGNVADTLEDVVECIKRHVS